MDFPHPVWAPQIHSVYYSQWVVFNKGISSYTLSYQLLFLLRFLEETQTLKMFLSKPGLSHPLRALQPPTPGDLGSPCPSPLGPPSIPFPAGSPSALNTLPLLLPGLVPIRPPGICGNLPLREAWTDSAKAGQTRPFHICRRP